ncbi:MAG: tetratricopeptide repeat protein [Nitrospiraceae bacterium]|nr:tetratricopeptide repeat protein [Nitrospiraceae bacterium]
MDSEKQREFGFREAVLLIKGKFFLILLILSLSSSCATTDSINKSDAYYRLGIAYLSSDKVQQAFVEFHKAYDLNPHNKEILNAIGIVYLLHLDETKKAIEWFDKAIKEDPSFSEAYNNLGYSYERLGDFDRAISFYRKALSNPLYPTAEKAYINMGNAYYRLGKNDAALQSYKEAIKRDPGLSLGYWRLALCLNAMGRYGEASTAITEAIKLDPLYLGNREKAVEDLRVKKLAAKGYEEKDIADYLEILKY